MQKNRKKEARNQKKLKSKEKALATKFHSQKGAAAKIAFRSPQELLRKSLFPLRKLIFAAKPFRSRLVLVAKIFAAAKPPFGTRAPIRRAVRPFRSCEMGYEIDAEFLLAAKTPSYCEIRASSLRKNPSVAKRNSDLWCSF